jgi:AcrR family transcriptional regulator
MNSRGRGRPPGPTRTREQILEVARRRFLAEGYQRVTLRSIAGEAGVDAALISYFFGSKRGLFGAAMSLAVNPADVIDRLLQADLNTLPERLIRTVVTVWDDPELGAPLRTLIDAAVREPEVTRLVREMFEREMVTRIAGRLRGPDAAHRAGVVGSQIAGLIFARYVLAMEPLASMSVDELTARLAPALRATMRGPARMVRGPAAPAAHRLRSDG